MTRIDINTAVNGFYERMQSDNPGLSVRAMRHNVDLALKGWKNLAEDGRCVVDIQDMGRVVPDYAAGDPRIMWVNADGVEIDPRTKKPLEPPDSSQYAEAEPAPPPEPGGDALAAGAKRFADLGDDIFGAKPKPADPGIDGDTYGRILDKLDEMSHSPGIRNLGGSEHVFEVGGVNYEPLAMCRSVDAAKNVAKELNKSFGAELGGDFGVVSSGKDIYVVSPANAKELKAGALPKGMKIE